MLELKPEYKLFFAEIKARAKYVAKSSEKVFKRVKAEVNAFINRLIKQRYQYNYFTIKECQKLQQKNKSNKRRLKAL